MINRRAVAKHLVHWLIPPGIQDSILASGLSQRRLSVSDRAILARNRTLHNRHRGERCFILATGPSIKGQDLTLLRNETCIAVSNFFVHPDYALIKPRYYCLAPHHPPITEDAWQAWMTELSAGVGEATMFFSLVDQQRNTHDGLFANNEIHFLSMGGAWQRVRTKGVDLTHPVPGPQSVPVMALLIAIYMGFQSIYLLGCDHDWILHVGNSAHFYNENRHALNRKNYDEWLGSDFSSTCQDYINLWQQYRNIRDSAKLSSTKIYNATDGGLLDVFPRSAYNTIFSDANNDLPRAMLRTESTP